MRHVSLYRKWRPRTFGAVAGQEPVIRTLRRALGTNRVAHAYLFSGPRGTGKTSTAKVLAMGLNCQASDGPTPEPDGTCESCRAVVNNSSMDVLEMDAASNRGIDEIRDLRDKVNLAPSQGRMKVYIIDEVHMLTTEAFNALLKMLEEPPEHVVFVLATTEKHKVLPTIISRCQSFDFRRPGVALLSEKLREIADAEGIEAEPAALTLISREARGSFRDAEGLLDQLASFADGPITAARVLELLGSVGSEALLETTDALYERRVADALRIVDRLQNEGKDLSRFAGELISHLRRLMLLPHAPEVALAEVGNEERAGLEEQALRIPTAEVVREIDALGDALSRAKRGGDPKLELELTFMKLARDYTEPSMDVLLSRLETLENALANGGAAAIAPPRAGEAEAPAAKQAAVAVPEVPLFEAREINRRPEQGSPEDWDAEGGIVEDATGAVELEEGSSSPQAEEEPAEEVNWGLVLSDLVEQKQKSTETIFKEARVSSFDGETLELVFPKEQAYLLDLAGDSRYLEPLHRVLKERLGKRPNLELRVAGADGPAVTGVSAVGANEGAMPVRKRPSSPDVVEVDPEEAPWPEEAPPREVESRDAGAAPEREAGPGVAGSGEEADSIIQDPREVLAIALDLFGPAGGVAGDKRNEGG
ncbi:MAG: DNA polymerase III subunit gamma/tau [Rubrobacteraceae bacterium]